MNVVDEVFDFYNNFQGEKGYIGQTGQGRLIPYMRVGNGKKTLLFQYAIHAREYITSYLALEQIKYLQDKKIDASFYFIPMLNIDGVLISFESEPLYKANAFGVDLNVNFDARWGQGFYNTRVKGSENYIGKEPFSESETKALRNFTYKVMPSLTVSYHSKGQEIYWYFYQQDVEKHLKFARIASSITGYKISNPYKSAGGYKDWCIEKLGIPSLTIEVGEDSLTHPITKEHLPKIAKENLALPQALAEAITE